LFRSVTIGIIWINHHTVMTQIGHVDRVFLMISVLFLTNIAFIPFPTRLLAEAFNHPDDLQAAAIAYGVTLTLTAILFNVLWRYAARGKRLLGAGSVSVSAHEGGSLIEFDSMTPVTGAAVAAVNDRLLKGGGLPWAISSGSGEVSRHGHVSVEVTGLVLAAGSNIGTNPIGT